MSKDKYVPLAPFISTTVISFSITLAKFTSKTGEELFNPSINYQLAGSEDNLHMTSLITMIYEVNPKIAAKRAATAALVYTVQYVDKIEIIDLDGNILPDPGFTLTDALTGEENGFIPLPVAQPAIPLYFFLNLHKYKDEDTNSFRYNVGIALVCEGPEKTRHAVTIMTEVWKNEPYEAVKNAVGAALKLAPAYKEQILIVSMVEGESHATSAAYFTISDVLKEMDTTLVTEEMPKYLH